MFTITEIHSGEALCTKHTTPPHGDPAKWRHVVGAASIPDCDPALFDTRLSAEVYAMENLGPDAGKEWRIEEVKI